MMKEIKTTFYGPIPKDWIECLFEDVIDGFSSGMTPYRGTPEFYKGDIPWITSGELNYNVITDTHEKITKNAIIKTNLKILPIGTFLMAITGLEAAGTRGSCGITGVNATTNQSCMALFPKVSKLDSKYLYHFYVKYGNELAFNFCQGTKQQSYTGRIAKILPINIPPTLTEQKAIATALSDVDTLITSLEQTIAKKKAIKQGAMQQLLTPPHKGGKRLPGFSGEWVEKELDQVLKFGSGQDYKHLSKGDIPVYGTGGIMTYVNSHLYNGDSVGIGRKGTIDKPVFLSGKFWTVDTLFYIENFLDTIPKFIYYKFLMIPWKEYNEASGVPSLNKNTLGKIKIAFPPTLTEQKAIAQILSDMDVEITQLESKKAKHQAIKQGMMQELLTGKTRLV